MIFKNICPYCGGSCETTGGPDGNPFNKNRKEETICTVCGRTISGAGAVRISDVDLQEMLREDSLLELMLDADIIENDTIETGTTEKDITIIDRINALDSIKLKISATSEGGGVKRTAETTVSIEDGCYSLGNEYPFGRSDIDQKPPFSLCDIMVKANEISIAGETFRIKELPKTITKKLTAYGYGYVPWVETITIMICME